VINILHIFIFLLIFAALILGIRFYLKTHSPEYKGFVGESIVAKYLSKLPENEYTILNNIYLKCRNGSIQIDHLIVSIYGIFVIETKNYSGWIFGNENQNYWTQIIFKSKTKFKNPIKQNISHVNTVKYLLNDYTYLKYFSVVVFTGSAELKRIDSFTPVIYEHQLYRYLLRSKEEQILNNETMYEIVSKINNNIIKDDEINEIHIRNVYKSISEKEKKVSSLICPKCNGSLIVRNGSYGKFYGCSNYPNCRFTTNY
jgi:hypothetical protein